MRPIKKYFILESNELQYNELNQDFISSSKKGFVKSMSTNKINSVQHIWPWLFKRYVKDLETDKKNKQISNELQKISNFNACLTNLPNDANRISDDIFSENVSHPSQFKKNNWPLL